MVVTDLIQLLLALVGALVVAVAALRAAGGMDALLSQLQDLGRPELLSLVPWNWQDGGIRWLDTLCCDRRLTNKAATGTRWLPLEKSSAYSLTPRLLRRRRNRRRSR